MDSKTYSEKSMISLFSYVHSNRWSGWSVVTMFDRWERVCHYSRTKALDFHQQMGSWCQKSNLFRFQHIFSCVCTRGHRAQLIHADAYQIIYYSDPTTWCIKLMYCTDFTTRNNTSVSFVNLLPFFFSLQTEYNHINSILHQTLVMLASSQTVGEDEACITLSLGLEKAFWSRGPCWQACSPGRKAE